MVLIIDDHPLILEGMTALLESSGYEVVQARGGARGIQLALDRKPNVVFCNFNMPDVDGLTVLHAMKDNPDTQSIPFVFISSDDPKSIRERCTVYEADAVLHKSDAGQRVVLLVKQYLDGQAPSG